MPHTIAASPVEEVDKEPSTGGASLGTQPNHGEVARRAYELFLARGCEHGFELQDWLDAERELTPAAPAKKASPRRKG
ncbi:MAG TPA: DUF2934 domain-containing protein [Methylomirabilota bacterium]